MHDLNNCSRRSPERGFGTFHLSERKVKVTYKIHVSSHYPHKTTCPYFIAAVRVQVTCAHHFRSLLHYLLIIWTQGYNTEKRKNSVGRASYAKPWLMHSQLSQRTSYRILRNSPSVCYQNFVIGSQRAIMMSLYSCYFYLKHAVLPHWFFQYIPDWSTAAL